MLTGEEAVKYSRNKCDQLSVSYLKHLPLESLAERLASAIDSCDGIQPVPGVVKNAKTYFKFEIPTIFRGKKDALDTYYIHADIKSFKDLKLPSAGSEASKIRLTELFIREAHQRVVDLNHTANIICKFDAHMVRPPTIYFSRKDNKWIVLDGQHTLLALWYLAVLFGTEETESIHVMILDEEHMNAMSDTEIRALFRNISKSAEPISHVDVFRHDVIAHRVDGVRTSDTVWADEIATLAQEHELFFTHANFKDSHSPGAISRMREWTQDTTIEGLTMFAKYYKVNGLSRTTKVYNETMDLLCDFFNDVAKSGIILDDSQLKTIYTWANDKFGADFEKKSLFYEACRESVKDCFDTDDYRIGKFSGDYDRYGALFLVKSLEAANLPGITIGTGKSINANGFEPSEYTLFS